MDQRPAPARVPPTGSNCRPTLPHSRAASSDRRHFERATDRLPQERLCELIGEQLLASGTLASPAPEFTAAAAEMVAEKVELVNDAEELIRDAMLYPLEATLASDAAASHVEGVVAVGQAVLAAHKAGELPALDDAGFSDAWKGWVKGVGKELGRKGKGLFMPLRIAMTGRMAGPDIPAQLRLLGLRSEQVTLDAASLDERMATLERALSSLPAPAEEAAAAA